MYDNQLAECAATPLISTRHQSLRERLEFKQKVLREELEAVNKALDLLNQNPAFEQFHDAVVRAGY